MEVVHRALEGSGVPVQVRFLDTPAVVVQVLKGYVLLKVMKARFRALMMAGSRSLWDGARFAMDLVLRDFRDHCVSMSSPLWTGVSVVLFKAG